MRTFFKRRNEAERLEVDGLGDVRPGLTRPLVRDTVLFGGWGPRLR
jgi:hypothetical protein